MRSKAKRKDAAKTTQAESKGKFKEGYASAKQKTSNKIWQKKSNRVKLHHSFRRSYREDYNRPLHVPGLMHHAMTTLKILAKNWRLFLPLTILIVLANIILVGLMSQESYKTFQTNLDDSIEESGIANVGKVAKASLILISTITTGGLNNGMSEAQQIFAVLLFVTIWLVAIYLLRHILAQHKVKLRDALYNAMSPLIPSLMVFAVLILYLIPIFIFIIFYSAAVTTEFFSTPFYACLFWVFASLLILLSLYLVPNALLALVAVSAPGIYPMLALRTATDLMQGRRIKFIIRLIFVLFFMAVFWIVIMVPIILLDQWLKSMWGWAESIPFVSFMLLLMTVMSAIYFTAYIYLFYRRMLDDPN